MRDLKQNHPTNRLFRLIRLRHALDRRAIRLRLAAELITAASSRHSELSNDTKTGRFAFKSSELCFANLNICILNHRKKGGQTHERPLRLPDRSTCAQDYVKLSDFIGGRF